MYKMFRQVEAQRNSAGDDTRGRLLDAAIEVFLAEGFRAARVQDIAERAGMRLSAINYTSAAKRACTSPCSSIMQMSRCSACT